MRQLEDIQRGLIQVAEAAGAEAREYLEQFAGTMANNVLAAVEAAELDISSPADLLAEVEAQARAVAETVVELSDRAVRQAVIQAVLGATRVALALVRPL